MGGEALRGAIQLDRRLAKSASEQDEATFLSVPTGHSSECQSSPGGGDGVPPPSWEGRVHLEQEEGRGGGEAAGFPGALSLLRSWRMR